MQVFFDPAPIGVSYEEIVLRASSLADPITIGGSRLVVHIQNTNETIDDFLALMRELAEEKIKAGFVRPEPEANGKTNGAVKNIYVKTTVKH